MTQQHETIEQPPHHPVPQQSSVSASEKVQAQIEQLQEQVKSFGLQHASKNTKVQALLGKISEVVKEEPIGGQMHESEISRMIGAFEDIAEKIKQLKKQNDELKEELQKVQQEKEVSRLTQLSEEQSRTEMEIARLQGHPIAYSASEQRDTQQRLIKLENTVSNILMLHRVQDLESKVELLAPNPQATQVPFQADPKPPDTVLEKNRVFLRANLEPEYLFPQLEQDGFLTVDDRELIQHYPTRPQRVNKLIDTLRKYGEKVHPSLSKALWDSGQDFIAECLQL